MRKYWLPFNIKVKSYPKNITMDSHLLSLPKEIRLQIWSYVLQFPHSTNLLVTIHRITPPIAPSIRYTNTLHRPLHSPKPRVKSTLTNPSSQKIQFSLLHTSREIYADALPLLYAATTFFPCAADGTWDIFLSTLSPFAKAHIRTVRLRAPDEQLVRSADYRFGWAITCAQVARLGGVRKVEVAVTGTGGFVKGNTGYEVMVRGLARIEAPKELIGGRDGDEEVFQQVLGEKVEELARKRAERRICAGPSEFSFPKQDGQAVGNTHSLPVAAPSVLKAVPTLSVDPQRIQHDFDTSWIVPPPIMDDDQINRDLRKVSGISQFQKELNEWVLVDEADDSTISSNDTVEPVDTKDNGKQGENEENAKDNDGEIWTDCASTIVENGRDDDSLSNEESSSSSEWEVIS